MLSNIVWSHIFLVNVVSKRWKYLRDQFVRKKREHETKLASGAGAPSATESKPDYIHYDRMTWILPYLSRARYAIHRLRHLRVLQCVTISFWIWPDDYLKILKTLVIICRGNSKKLIMLIVDGALNLKMRQRHRGSHQLGPALWRQGTLKLICDRSLFGICCTGDVSLFCM